MTNLPQDWNSFPVCSSCTDALSPEVARKIDPLLDHAVTEGQQQMQRIIHDVGKVLVARAAPPSFFPEQGQRAQRITYSGVQWRSKYENRKRREAMAARLAQIQPGASLGLGSPQKLDDLRREYLNDTEDPTGTCRFCCWSDGDEADTGNG